MWIYNISSFLVCSSHHIFFNFCLILPPFPPYWCKAICLFCVEESIKFPWAWNRKLGLTEKVGNQLSLLTCEPPPPTELIKTELNLKTEPVGFVKAVNAHFCTQKPCYFEPAWQYTLQFHFQYPRKLNVAWKKRGIDS